MEQRKDKDGRAVYNLNLWLTPEVANFLVSTIGMAVASLSGDVKNSLIAGRNLMAASNKMLDTGISIPDALNPPSDALIEIASEMPGFDKEKWERVKAQATAEEAVLKADRQARESAHEREVANLSQWFDNTPDPEAG